MKRIFQRLFIVGLLFSFLLTSASFFPLIAEEAATDETEEVAEETTDKSEELEEKKQEITKLEDKISQTRQKKQTLASQIAYMNQRIELARLKIEQTNAEIIVLEDEIADLTEKIGKLDVSLDKISQILLHRVVETYKSDKSDNFLALLSEEGGGSLVRNSRYLQQAQKHDKMLMVAVEEAKQNFDARKELKEEKQAKLEELKAQLEEQNNQLEQQKQEKAYLLKVTRNDEERYQQMLAEARRELAEIEQAALALKRSGESVHVKKGEVIGVQGNTGYSFGDHLHFGVYDYSAISELDDGWYLNGYLNPLDYLSSRRVDWRSGCGTDGIKNVGNGSWQWPMDNFKITQGFGYTCHVNALYDGKPHPAIDIAGSKNALIHAIDEGEAYFCRNCDQYGANGVFIFHPSGKMTMYWHVK